MPRTAKGERIGHKHAGDDAECLISGAVQCRIRPMRRGGNLANLSMRSQPAKLKHMLREPGGGKLVDAGHRNHPPSLLTELLH